MSEGIYHSRVVPNKVIFHLMLSLSPFQHSFCRKPTMEHKRGINIFISSLEFFYWKIHFIFFYLHASQTWTPIQCQFILGQLKICLRQSWGVTGNDTRYLWQPSHTGSLENSTQKAIFNQWKENNWSMKSWKRWKLHVLRRPFVEWSNVPSTIHNGNLR